MEGLIYLHLWPGDVDEEELRAELCAMTPADRCRYAVKTEISHNLLTSAGRHRILLDLGSGTNASNYANYLGIGNGTIAAVGAGDFAIAGEFIRVANNGYTVNSVAYDVDISFFMNTSQGNSTYTNLGLWYNASSTPGSGGGILLTHALSTFTKTSAHNLTIDYIVSIV